MSKITGKVTYKEVLKGDTGYTFEPHVTVDGILYWTNNGNLENPLPVNLHGKQGFMFIPHVDSEGNLSWTNTGELENPPTVNIKGDKGYFYTPHISEDGILTWSNNGGLENPQPFNISDLILNEVKESRIDTTGKTFSKLKERLDSDFKKLNESIKNNDTKDEVVQARTATTGENFMTLDDRIDHEVMRLREKIEVTMLEQEDKETHDISNTVEGLTINMIIKGKTMYKKKDGSYTDTWLDGVTLESFGEKEGNKISILSSGKNMVNLSSWNIKEVVDGKECYISHGYSSTSADTGNPIILKLTRPVQQGEKVTVISMNKATKYFNDFRLFNSQTKQTQTLGKNEQKNVWVNYKNTVPSNSYYDSIQIDTGEANQKGFIESLFVGVGDNLNYQEYKEDKKDILIKEPLHESNYLYEDNGQVKVYEKKKKYTFTGDENWATNSNVENEKTLYFYTNVLDNSIDKININNIVCNTLPTLSNYDSTCVTDSIFNTNGSNNIRIRISKSKLKSQDLEGFKAWLKANPTTIVYQLAEPTVEIVENCVDINLDTYDEKTYVSFQNVFNGTSSFKLPVNTNKLINTLKFEKEELKEKFNNLNNEFENFKTLMIQTLPYKGV